MITVNAFHAKSLADKVAGLIGKKEAYVILIKTRWGIHTIGLQFIIDVVVLDETNTIVKLKEGLKPNRIFLWNPVYSQILELPQGMIKSKGLEVGKKIKLELS